MICFCCSFFDRANETNTYEIKPKRLRSQILTSFIFLVLFLKNHGFIEEGIPSKRVVIVGEELDGTDVDYIRILGNLPILVFIDEE